MITLFLLLACAQANHSPTEWLPSELLESAGFKVETARVGSGYRVSGRQHLPFSAFAARSSGVRASIMLRASSIEPARDQDLLREDMVSGRLDDMQHRTPSGIPLGADSRWSALGGPLVLLFSTRYEEGVAHLQLQRSPRQTFTLKDERAWIEDRQLLERVVRYSLARIAGRRLGKVKPLGVSGDSIPMATCRLSNAKFGDLRSWCAAKGWTMTENKELGVLTLKRGAAFVVIPMGTAWVKWHGRNWNRISDVVMERDGRVMAPEEVLDRLNTM